MNLPSDVARCIGGTGGPSGYSLRSECAYCMRRLAPRAEVQVMTEPPPYPCPIRIAPPGEETGKDAE